MKCDIRFRHLEDFPSDLSLMANMRLCDKCGEPTMWASPRQKVKGRHWGCISGITFWGVTDVHAARVVLAVIAAFPGSHITSMEPVGTVEVGYAGPGEGPCSLCGGAIRRYGEGGLPLCKKCDQERINGGTA